MADQRTFDVIIVGAGPAGTATAISLKDSGLSVALLDKATFPRDKICGDALSIDVVNQLEMLAPLLSLGFSNLESKSASYGVKIFSPDRNSIEVPFIYRGEKACGYTCQRIDFDALLMKHLINVPNVKVLEGCEVFGLENEKDKIEIESNHGTFSAKFIVGCDGAHSIVAKNLQNLKPDKDHYSAGLRVYYEGVASFHPENFIELHFMENILPGYLWIFPLPGNKANVGIGMLSSAVSRKKINLRQVLSKFLSTDPHLKERFKSARPLETIKGFGLPLGSGRRPMSGHRFILTGDAASLIDPFTGEGIANAIRSGRIAAAHILKSFQKQDFSASFNLQYDVEIDRKMWQEFQLSRNMQKLCRYPFLFNFIVRKANKHPKVHQFLIDSLADTKKKKTLTHPGFYYKLLFRP